MYGKPFGIAILQPAEADPHLNRTDYHWTSDSPGPSQTTIYIEGYKPQGITDYQQPNCDHSEILLGPVYQQRLADSPGPSQPSIEGYKPQGITDY